MTQTGLEDPMIVADRIRMEAPELFARMQTANMIVTDWDHTQSDAGAALYEFELIDEETKHVIGMMREARVNPDNYTPEEIANIDYLIENALDGAVVSVITGKGANILPTSTFLANRLVARAQERGLEAYDDGRFVSSTDTPVIFTFSNGNGGQTFDIAAPTPGEFDPCAPEANLVDRKPIPDSFWQSIADPKIDGLLRDTSAQSRINTLARVTPQFVKDSELIGKAHTALEDGIDAGETVSTNDSIWLTGDYLCLDPSRVKANLVFDVDKVMASDSLQARWQEATGIELDTSDADTCYESLVDAFGMLADANGWEIYYTKANAHGVMYIDITHPDVEKGKTMTDVIQPYAANLYEKYGAEAPDWTPVMLGDAPLGNDQTMLEQPGGIAVVTYDQGEDRHNDPVYIARLLGGALGWPDYPEDGMTAEQKKAEKQRYIKRTLQVFRTMAHIRNAEKHALT